MSHPAFELIRSVPIPNLHIEVAEYCHRKTRARHFHIAANDNNNAFLVAFLTVPQDSTGVAHILEHTSLCGSERYPVRDPFFMMIRRSLNTFMNAFTASDWTAYPFATQNRKDFYNLLQVYLDAAFFPKLEELDFAQEGHRVEFAEANNPASPLVYKGVVFNEMKGAMSSPISALWQALGETLYPTTTYHYNSGGEPSDIPDLTWEQLKAFHAEHYHPSNAVFITYGDLPADEHQRYFEEQALHRFDYLDTAHLQIPDEQRYTAPLTRETTYALEGEEDTRNKTHIVLAWLLGRSNDLRERMNAHLLSGVLLDNSASPLRHALETCGLGTAPSPLCGTDSDLREMNFSCGLEGSNPEQAEAVEALILQVLEHVAEQGVPQEQVESVLHQIELSQREITGDRFPYGLRLMLNALSPALHGGDAVAALDLDAPLAQLREDIQDPEFIKNLVRRLLLDNPHRVRLVMQPDKDLAAQRDAAEKAALQAMQATLSEEEKQRIIELAAALKARQEGEEDNPDLLPKVTLADVPEDIKIPQGEEKSIAAQPATWFAQGTNGMVYAQVVVELPALREDLLDILPLYCDNLTEVGIGDKDYLQVQNWQAAVSGGIGARCSVRGGVDDVQQSRGLFILGGKALARNQNKLSELMQATFSAARFDEHQRLRELIAQTRADMESSITGRGSALAMSAACSGMNPTGRLAHDWGGMEGIRRIKQLDDALEDQQKLAELAARFEELRELLSQAPRRYLLIADESEQDPLLAAMTQNWQHLSATPSSDGLALHIEPHSVRQGWATSTQVNFCAKAYPSVAYSHPDAPVLMVLGEFLRNGYLHRAIREQGGAYGGGAGYDQDTGAFRFFSYRDPRLQETLADFDASLAWLQEHPHDQRSLEESVLTIISRLDRPASPAGEAKSSYFGSLHGRTPEQRRQFRSRVLQVTLDDLQRVAKAYLQPERASLGIISSQSKLQSVADKLELTLHKLH